jgi:hypothetical protein
MHLDTGRCGNLLIEGIDDLPVMRPAIAHQSEQRVCVASAGERQQLAGSCTDLLTKLNRRSQRHRVIEVSMNEQDREGGLPHFADSSRMRVENLCWGEGRKEGGTIHGSRHGRDELNTALGLVLVVRRNVVDAGQAGK